VPGLRIASKKHDVKQTPLHYDEGGAQRGMMLDVTFVSGSMKVVTSDHLGGLR
jgi:hypothetical protein